MKRKNKILIGFIVPLIMLFVSIFGIGLGLPNGNWFSSRSITAGASVERGGAIYLKSGASYTMKGGSIKNKTATYGGAVYVCDGATFNMQGGEISGNLADYGSGVYVESGGTFNMSSGEMEDNVYASGSMVYSGGTVSGTITLTGSENLTIGAVPAEPLNIVAQTTAVGTKLIKVTANDFEISDVNVSGLPTGRRVVLSSGYVVVDYTYHTVTIGVNDSGYGSVSKTSVTVPYGTSISSSGSTLTVGSNTITATPATKTAQYTYAFSSWTGASGTVTGNKTITANFTRTVNKYTVTLGTGYGSWDTGTAITVDYGTSISVSSNKLTVGSTTRTFTKSANGAQYSYAFSSLSGVPSGGKVIANVTITPNVTRTVNQYAVTLASGFGSWDTATAITVDYGTSISVSSNKVTVGGTTRTFTKTANDAQYTYTFNSLSVSPSGSTVTGATTVTPNVTRTTNQYVVTIAVSPSGYGSVSKTSVTVDYGTSISSSGSTLTVGSNSITATPATKTAEYTYSFSSWTGASGTVTGAKTITANFTRTANSYTVTYNATTNGGTFGNASGYSSTASVNYGSAIDLSKTNRYGSKSGWTFVGWNTSSTATTALSSLTMGTSNVTLYAIYSKTLTGTFYYGLSKASNKTVSTTIYNTATSGSITTPANQANVTYNSRTFTALGWRDDTTAGNKEYNASASVTISANTSFYQVYSGTLTLSYNANSGSSTPSSQTATQYYNSNGGASSHSFTLASAISRTGHTFSKWAAGSTSGTQYSAGGSVSISSNTTFYAIWTINTYTLSYSNGYYYASTATDVTVSASSGTLSRTTINSTNSSFTLTATYSTSPITITFTRKNTNRNYVVWWDGYNGSTNTVSRTWTPTADESNSWYLREVFSVTATAGTGISSATFTGTDCWGNALGTSSSATLYYGSNIKFSATVATGYTWSKWSNGSTTQTNYNITTSLTSDISLTASATINKYTVTLGSGYGSWDNSASITANYGTSISVSSNKVTVGSTTRTWTTSATTAQYSYSFGSLSLSPSSSTVTSNITVTPNVTRTTRSYTVTWKNYNGTVLETDTGVSYGTTPTYNGSTPSRSTDDSYHYSFSGWSPSVGAITGATTYTAQFSTTAHTYGDYISTTAPTCTSQGYDKYECNWCSRYVYKNYTSATGHSWSTTGYTTGANCTTQGNTNQKCSKCGSTQTVSGGGYYGSHAYSFSYTTSPTCTAQGYDTYKCTYCKGTTTTNYKSATGHNWDFYYETSGSNCLDRGDEYQKCSSCAETRVLYNEGTYGDHLYYENSYTSANNCQERSETEYKCEHCDDTYTSYGGYGSHDYTCIEMTEGPDCETEGTETYECEYCGDTYTISGGYYGPCNYELMDSGGGENCQSEEWEDYECAYCGDTYTEWLGTYGSCSYSSDYTRPTCEDDGYWEYECDYCGDSFTENDDGSARGHNWDYYGEDDDGSTILECTECGAMTTTWFLPNKPSANNNSGVIIQKGFAVQNEFDNFQTGSSSSGLGYYDITLADQNSDTEQYYSQDIILNDRKEYVAFLKENEKIA